VAGYVTDVDQLVREARGAEAVLDLTRRRSIRTGTVHKTKAEAVEYEKTHHGR